MSSNTRQRQFPSKMSTTAFVKMYILHLLNENTYYGNQIIDEIKNRLNGKWEPSPGMVYPLLRELETNGYIEGSWDEPDKRSIRRYRITNKGYDHYERIKLKNKATLRDSLIMLEHIIDDIYKGEA